MNRDGVKKTIKASIFTLMTLIVIGYSFFSFKDYIDGPRIIINEPVNGSSATTPAVTIVGKALHIQDISVNNRPILIDDKGNFSETILLSPGYNVSLISAKDKFNRTIEYKLELVYQDKK